jgi:hypothetical protein
LGERLFSSSHSSSSKGSSSIITAASIQSHARERIFGHERKKAGASVGKNSLSLGYVCISAFLRKHAFTLSPLNDVFRGGTGSVSSSSSSQDGEVNVDKRTKDSHENSERERSKEHNLVGANSSLPLRYVHISAFFYGPPY